ncbi:MAG TPA: polyprenyl synthetase family protein, partial [Anaerolineales bacterium]|nr:polyprenyl synthetase family protein [Anaerolineales bacterium]
YWPMIAGKTAALLSACCHIGSILGGVDESKQDAYRSFGHALGMAFQVQDDILGIWGDEAITGKSAASDLLEGKKSLPVLHGLSKGGKFAGRWTKGPIHPDEVEELAQVLAREGSYEYTHSMSRQMTTMALDSLREADPQGEAGEALMELANKLIKREQ